MPSLALETRNDPKITTLIIVSFHTRFYYHDHSYTQANINNIIGKHYRSNLLQLVAESPTHYEYFWMLWLLRMRKFILNFFLIGCLLSHFSDILFATKGSQFAHLSCTTLSIV